MPNETFDVGHVPDDDEIERTRLLWRDDGFLRELDVRETEAKKQEKEIKIQDDLASADRHLAMEREVREERAAQGRPTTDYGELLPADIKAKESHRRAEADQVYEELERSNQFQPTEIRDELTARGLGEVKEVNGEVVSDDYEKELLEITERHRQIEQKKSHESAQKHASNSHKTRNGRSRKLRGTNKPGRGGDKDAPSSETHLDSERIIR